jgi:hypothetical protein
MSRSVIGFSLIAILSLAGAMWAPCGAVAAAKAKAPSCPARNSLAGATVCDDPTLADDDRWLDRVLHERLAMADKESAKAILDDQKAFARARNACLPKPPAPEPEPAAAPDSGPSAAASPDAASPGGDGQAAPAPDGAKIPTLPGQGAADAAVAAPADAAPDASQPSEQQVLSCLRGVYNDRIAALEAPLRRQVDLEVDAPGAGSICAALTALKAEGGLRLIARHAIPVTDIDQANEMHPSVKNTHLRRYMSQAAWDQAEDAAPWWKNALGAVTIERANLRPNEGDDWILSTLAGDGHDRNVFIFQPSEDGAVAGQMIGHLGGDGAGPFEPAFVRFKGQAFMLATPSSGDGANATILAYALDQPDPLCGPAVNSGVYTPSK